MEMPPRKKRTSVKWTFGGKSEMGANVSPTVLKVGGAGGGFVLYSESLPVPPETSKSKLTACLRCLESVPVPMNLQDTREG
jgi:hypothetical protein